jgi:pyridoxamine 5'-phosphate oxidase
MSIAQLRKDYTLASLSEPDMAPDPIVQFAKWFDEARQAHLPEPNAMSVATVGADGRPSSRIMLIKEFDARGFTWFTNYESRKGEELRENPYVALLFHWIELERQVRIEGRVERLLDAENEAYFQSRPVKSRHGAIASGQSKPIENRQLLDAKFADTELKYGEQTPRPAHWGGYRVIPDRIEFWQGRSSRMHDRLRYTRQPDGLWRCERLQP